MGARSNYDELKENIILNYNFYINMKNGVA